MKEVIISVVSAVIFVVGISATVVGLYHIMGYAIEQRDIVECNRLERYSQQFEYFWVTKWQADMCNTLGFSFAGTEQAPILVHNGEEYQAGVWYYNDAVGKFINHSTSTEENGG